MTPERLERALGELKGAPIHQKLAAAENLGDVALQLAWATDRRLKELEEKCRTLPATK